MVIWTNDLNYDEWKADMEALYPEEEGFTEDFRIKTMYEMNDSYLEDEKDNLYRELDNHIVLIADLGLWNGRRSAYRILGTNLNSIFSYSCGDYVTWFTESEDVKCTDIHHDGTNNYTYRMLKCEPYKFEEFAEEHSFKEAVEKYTEPIKHYVAEIYGWKE